MADRRAQLRLVPGLGAGSPDADELGHRVVVQWGPVDPELVRAACRCGAVASGGAVPGFVRAHSVHAEPDSVRHPSIVN